MKEIGGYFELEIGKPDENYYFETYLHLNTARNALEYILTNNYYSKVYLPYFTCDVILEPILKLNLEYEFYDIDNNLAPIFNLNNLKSDQVIILNNYFGITTNTITTFLNNNKNVIIDNAQALFAKPIPNLDTIYSPRKFVGIPDGGFLISKLILDKKFKIDTSCDRMSHLLKRLDSSAQNGYKDFKNNDDSLGNNDIKLMSNLTSKILRTINFKDVIASRKSNFKTLSIALNKYNELSIDSIYTDNDTPMVYPFRIKNANILREQFLQNNIYCATYWPNVLNWCNDDTNSYWLTKEIIPIPVDQRYNKKEMNFIIEIVTKFINRKTC